MQTVAVAEVLAAEGLAAPVLNVLVPNEQNYSAGKRRSVGIESDKHWATRGVCIVDLPGTKRAAYVCTARHSD
jgi:uncharacterized protein YceK